MNPEPEITIERIDDFVLLIEMMLHMNLPKIIDHHIPRHHLQQGLSWGWVSTIWLAHILSRADHRKLTVRDWVRQAHETLERITGLNIRDADFTDDRLAIVLTHLSKPEFWQAIEGELDQQTLRVYDLAIECVRLDGTTVSGYHAESESGLFQFGHSKDDPSLRQIKLMQAALDPLGLPLVTHIVQGERADDELYTPVIAQVLQILQKQGLLFVGDCKMSALATRAYLQGTHNFYLSPLAMVGHNPEDIQTWIGEALLQAEALRPIYDLNEKGERVVMARAYETQRAVSAEVDGKTEAWTERVLVVHSENYAEIQQRGLEKRLATATAKLMALTPPVGRGKRQIREEAALAQAATAILQAYRVEGLLGYEFERQETHQTRYIGRGRGQADRPKREIVTVRYQMTRVSRQAEAIAALEKTMGWRVYVTNAPPERLTLEAAVLSYRDEWRIERGFHRLKDAPLSIAPLFVKRDDQIAGLGHLLSIAVRLLTLIEFIVRCALQQNGEKLVGLHAENPKKETDQPTTERLLKAFDNLYLTIVHLPDQVIRHVTPLKPLQVRILELLGLSPDIYRSLASNSS
jgi:transposase